MLQRAAGTVQKRRALHDADEGVADGAQLVVHARTPAPVAVAPLEWPPRHDVRVGGGAALAAAAIPDHLHVLGVGERLAEVAIEVGAVARDDEDLTRHRRSLYHPFRSSGTLGAGPRVLGSTA